MGARRQRRWAGHLERGLVERGHLPLAGLGQRWDGVVSGVRVRSSGCAKPYGLRVLRATRGWYYTFAR